MTFRMDKATRPGLKVRCPGCHEVFAIRGQRQDSGELDESDDVEEVTSTPAPRKRKKKRAPAAKPHSVVVLVIGIVLALFGLLVIAGVLVLLTEGNAEATDAIFVVLLGILPAGAGSFLCWRYFADR